MTGDNSLPSPEDIAEACAQLPKDNHIGYAMLLASLPDAPKAFIKEGSSDPFPVFKIQGIDSPDNLVSPNPSASIDNVANAYLLNGDGTYIQFELWRLLRWITHSVKPWETYACSINRTSFNVLEISLMVSGKVKHPKKGGPWWFLRIPLFYRRDNKP